MIFRTWGDSWADLDLSHIEEGPIFAICREHQRRHSGSIAAHLLLAPAILVASVLPYVSLGAKALLFLPHIVALAWLIRTVCFAPLTRPALALRLHALPHQDPQLWLIPARPTEWGHALWAIGMRRVRVALAATLLPTAATAFAVAGVARRGIEHNIEIVFLGAGLVLLMALWFWMNAGIHVALSVAAALDDATVTSPSRTPPPAIPLWPLAGLLFRYLVGVVGALLLACVSCWWMAAGAPYTVMVILLAADPRVRKTTVVEALRVLDEASERFTGHLHPDFPPER